MFSWVPLYKEIVAWVLTYRYKQNELCDILRKIGFTGNLEDEDTNGKKPFISNRPIHLLCFFHEDEKSREEN
jgi:hypothetical protein